jgi:hypothetical protein
MYFVSLKYRNLVTFIVVFTSFLDLLNKIKDKKREIKIMNSFKKELNC